MILETKFGTAKISEKGYYKITSAKENNYGKLLHRLIWEDWYGKPIPKSYDIHHIDGSKLNNNIQNLQCIEHKTHIRYHSKNRSDETLEKISKNSPKIWEGKNFSNNHNKNLSLSHNSTGYFRVYKEKSNIPQGFIWRYQCSINGSRIRISSKSLEKLEEKVKKRGLEWEQF